MKKTLINLVSIFLFFGLFSCDSLEEPHETDFNLNYDKELNFKVSSKEAIEIATSFLGKFKAASEDLSRSFEEKEIKVANVKAISNIAEVSRSNGIDTLMYAVNMADNQGFVLISADKRAESILAYIEEGNFDSNSLHEDMDEGFLLFVDMASRMIKEDVDNYYKYGNVGQSRASLIIGGGYDAVMPVVFPMQFLRTKWTQDGVYGKYCPNNVGGCVILATAQIMSYYQTIGHVNWSYQYESGSSDLHWDTIIADCNRYDGKLTGHDCAQSADEVAHLIRYLGLTLKADYKSDGSTGAKSSNAIDWFNTFGGLKASKLSDYNETNILNAIKSGKLVYGDGYSGKKKFLGIRVGWKDGHAWVYDGAAVGFKDGKQSVLLHCNWGWGGYKDGFYLSKVFDISKGAPVYDSEDEQDGNAPNYRYNLKYSIIEER